MLRGAAGDWKSETGFRLYLGDEDQPVDPLIAAAEGVEETPAYRGTAYAVFEHMALGDYANHIPSLTFEVEADGEAVALDAIAETLSEGAIGGSAPLTLDGFAASGDSVRGAIATLGRATGLSIRGEGEVLRFADPEAAAVVVLQDSLGADAADRRQARSETQRAASGAIADEIAVSYYEPARDYQAGLQRARRGGPGRRSEQIELPAALSAARAKAIAETRLADVWADRTRRTVRLPWSALGLAPGDRLRLPDSATRWRVTDVRFEKMVVEASLAGVGTALPALPPAMPGRATGDADSVHGPTQLHILDLPPLSDAPLSVPRLWIAAAGSSPGWRRAALMASLDGGVSFNEIGATAAPATMGIVLTPPVGGSSMIFDEAGFLDVELLHDAMTLEGRTADAMIGGANMALIGDELIQFGVVTPISARQYRLSRLLRGRRGSEWAMGGHVAGERFVLLEAESLLVYDVPLASLGGAIEIVAAGVGDAVAVSATAPVIGRALRPPAPVHLHAPRIADGAIAIHWVRRSRTGWPWIDGDTPLGEESERYRLQIIPDSGAARTVETGAPAYLYSVLDQAADGAVGATSLAVSVVQIGAIAVSYPAAQAIFDV